MFRADSEGTCFCINNSQTKRIFITMNIGHIIKRNPLSVPLGVDSDIATIVAPVCVHYLGGCDKKWEVVDGPKKWCELGGRHKWHIWDFAHGMPW